MEREEMFQINYDGRNFEIPKSSVKFEHGYAVVVKTIKTSVRNWGGWSDSDLHLTGIINEDYRTVFDFKGWFPTINIYSEGNFIVTVRFSGGDGEQAYIRHENHHYKMIDNVATKIRELSSWEYLKINDNVVQTKNNVFMSGSEALYDVVAGQFISDEFSIIGKFEKVNEDSDRIAKAIVRLPYGEKTRNVCDVICYIDENGKIRTPLYNSHDDSTIDSTVPEFSLTSAIDGIKAQIKEDSSKKTEIANKLIKSITPNNK